MEDKEVGQLWRRLTTRCVVYQCEHHAELRGLICKLVETRKFLHLSVCGYCADLSETVTPEEAEQQALRDFGIDPGTWK